MAQEMTSEEYRGFLTAGTRTAKVATIGADGRPHVVPIWFVLDGDTVVFTTGDRSAKALHMRRNPRVALCVDDETPPYAFILIDGTVETSPNPPDMLNWTTRIARRYMGAGCGCRYCRRPPAPCRDR